ncbi:hypothetical protein P775_16930 [Puniceibacterium antarcticum]|uniref:Uncharacterized protein n=1 Tax=Puniceibacterium antarcticum TaxID=1206336 RepID=A0A2G8RBP0_9RHOB|nr:hypothetical protein [Puniceibacterium antarcticum]PIL18950.1 hypothetical protein P775_16930 [Puniceibacterium antarcticum]
MSVPLVRRIGLNSAAQSGVPVAYRFADTVSIIGCAVKAVNVPGQLTVTCEEFGVVMDILRQGAFWQADGDKAGSHAAHFSACGGGGRHGAVPPVAAR